MHLNLVNDHRLVGKVDDGLRHCQGQGPESCAITAENFQLMNRQRPFVYSIIEAQKSIALVGMVMSLQGNIQHTQMCITRTSSVHRESDFITWLVS